MRYLSLVAMLVLCFGLTACDNSSTEAPAPTTTPNTPSNGENPDDPAAAAGGATETVVVNTACPISDKAIKADVTFVHDGKTYGFCCQDCVEEFKKNPAAALAAQ